jgi:hypothetical protein
VGSPFTPTSDRYNQKQVDNLARRGAAWRRSQLLALTVHAAQQRYRGSPCMVNCLRGLHVLTLLHCYFAIVLYTYFLQRTRTRTHEPL